MKSKSDWPPVVHVGNRGRANRVHDSAVWAMGHTTA